MTVPVYVVASNMLGQSQRLDMIADNVANVNTSGYKKLDMDFAELVSKKETQDVASFNLNLGTSTNFTPGALSHTGNDFDLALQGNGFFGIDDGTGNILYTRNGHFSINAEGNLVNDRGQAVLDNNNAPITIPADSDFVHITENGAISDQNGVIASVGVFDFDNPQLLRRAGFGTWLAEGTGANAFALENALVKQGFLESSNVDPIAETVEMTTMLRHYQSAARLINQIEDMESQAIDRLSSMPN